MDWAARAGQRLWQVLPLGPVGADLSPYSGHSAFAGNPLLISPDRLVEEGLLAHEDLGGVPSFEAARVEYARVAPWKQAFLRRAHERFRAGAPGGWRENFAAFLEAEGSWLNDWTRFAALKDRFGERWAEWPEELRARNHAKLDAFVAEQAREIEFHAFAQFLFFSQWDALRRAANERGVQILGDIPIYVSIESADVWAHPQLFDLDAKGRPREVAGVPPDYFSQTGQLWGNPLYRWEVMAKDDFAWWVERLRANFRLANVVRIDHFRAFAGYWAVPASEPTAVKGRWRRGPGRAFFKALRGSLGELPIVAEDLGLITPDVERLLAFTGFPRMKVLQFAFGKPDDPFQPHNHVPNVVVYTGTHDNDTTRGWWATLDEPARQRARDYFGCDGHAIEWDLIRAAYESVAERAVVPMQDVLGLGSEARMNVPARPEGNWSWRARREDFRQDLADGLRNLAELTGRI